ncbi:myelin and lymphocyte protein-like [Trichomycterus rosablanca]|uniref:myelin and lymphocyte protein-like n=1 Tax=Trichomycterus rosablanca TaxID=2290929 RepID=UPI002F355A25
MESGRILPSGFKIFCSIPDVLFLPELVCGGAVWILIACANVDPAEPLAYVIFISILCFILSIIWMTAFICGLHRNHETWVAADVLYHGAAALLYMSALSLLAYIVTVLRQIEQLDVKIYRLDVAAVVLCTATTILYIIHTLFSAIRWKST